MSYIPRKESQWSIVEFTPEEAERFDRRVYNVSDDCGLGWTPYTYRAQKNAISQWACHDEAEFQRHLAASGLPADIPWSAWDNGMRHALVYTEGR